eukprot:900132-Pleurochrysis_carterae.AAC.1
MPYWAVAPDPLHAYLNIFAAVFKHSIWQVLQPTEHADDGVNAVKQLARAVINAVINDLSAPMGIDFMGEKIPKLNGNCVKAMLCTKGYISGVVRAMTPVYNLALPTSKAAASVPKTGNKRDRGRRVGLPSSNARGEHKPTEHQPAAPAEATSAEMGKAFDKMLEAEESRRDIRLAAVFECAITHWENMTFNGYDSDDMRIRQQRSAQLHELGKDLADAAIDLLGKERQCTYLHDIVYTFPNLMDDVSKGGKKRKSDGLRKDEYMQQVIERRQAATAAAHEMSQINHSTAARHFTKLDENYNCFYKVEEAKTELQDLRSEIRQQRVAADAQRPVL